MIKRHLLESKDHLIDRLPTLSSEQKEELKAFFRKHPNYENKVDWNNRNLEYSDFKDLLALEGKSKSQAKKNGLEGLIEGTDYDLVKTFPKAGYTLYQIYTHLASKTIASSRVGYGDVTGKWCISMNSAQYWYRYMKWGWVFFFLVADKEIPYTVPPAFRKIAFAYNRENPRISREYRLMAFNADDSQYNRDWIDRFVFNSERAELQEVYDLIKDLAPRAKISKRQTVLDALLRGTGGIEFGGPGHGFSFSKPAPARVYVKVLMMLKGKALTKREILTNLNINNDIPQYDTRGHYDRQTGKWVDTQYTPETYWQDKNINVGGQHSNMFIAMREAGLIQYDQATRTWSWGPNAKPYIEHWDLDKKWNEYLKTHPRHDKY